MREIFLAIAIFLAVIVFLNATSYYQVGIASWYGEKFHGRRTSSGEIYNMYDMTAAHKTLPFGTKVLVIDLKTGRRVIVRINDRGPFIRGRIIDLSFAAAKKLGIVEKGITRVGIKIVQRPK